MSINTDLPRTKITALNNNSRGRCYLNKEKNKENILRRKPNTPCRATGSPFSAASAGVGVGDSSWGWLTDGVLGGEVGAGVISGVV